MVASGPLRARVLGAGSGGIAPARVIKPTAAAGGGVSAAAHLAARCSARCSDAPRGKSRRGACAVRKKVKLTGEARLSVAVGGERVRERVIGPCGISWAGAHSRPAVGGASARGVGPRHNFWPGRAGWSGRWV